jgi:hypothetical protein
LHPVKRFGTPNNLDKNSVKKQSRTLILTWKCTFALNIGTPKNFPLGHFGMQKRFIEGFRAQKAVYKRE